MDRKILEELHSVLVQELLDRIKNGTASPADLNVARSILKDNAIDCIATPESPLAKLALTMRSKAFGTG